jgi:hypothetical protein
VLLTVAAGSEVVVTLSAVTETVMLRNAALVAAGVSESVTYTVKFDVPLAVGVPEITPVAVFNVRPAGKLPRVTAQVYG